MKMITGIQLRFGIAAGLLSVLYTLVLFFVDRELFLKYGGALSILVPLAIAVTCMMFGIRKDDEAATITFKNALLKAFAVWFIYALFNTAFEYVLYYLIDPGFGDYLKQQAIDKSTAWMEKFNRPQEEIDKIAAEMSKENPNPRPLQSLWKILFSSVIGLILSAILAAILRKKNPAGG